MPVHQDEKLLWLINTVRSARKITFEEVSTKWKQNVEMSGGVELLKRTFHKWRNQIRMVYHLDIVCERGGSYFYYIENEDDLQNGSLEKWLLETHSIAQLVAQCKSMKDRILLEEIPSGSLYLNSIIEAMRQNRFVHIDYASYCNTDVTKHYIMPLCIKLFRQRWYLVGKRWPVELYTIFCLDRICDFRVSSHTFKYPEDFSPEAYFHGCIGVIADADTDVELVRLKVHADQAHYLRDLPLHSSQKETERCEQYSIFELFVRPTYDFKQEVLWNADRMEVLSPLWLRDSIADLLKKMSKKYSKKLKG